jgi:hypothetical protein
MIDDTYRCQDSAKGVFSKQRVVTMPVDKESKIPLMNVYTLLLINIKEIHTQLNILLIKAPILS